MLCLYFSIYYTDFTCQQYLQHWICTQLHSSWPLFWKSRMSCRRNQQLSIKMNFNIALNSRLLLVTSNPFIIFKNQIDSGRDTNSSYSCKWKKADFVHWQGPCGWQLQKVYVWHTGGCHYCQLSSISIRAPAPVLLGVFLQATWSSQYSAIVKTG